MEVSLWLISVVVGVVIAFVVVGVMKGQLKSVRRQSGASNYVAHESFDLTISQDVFLYARTTRTPRNVNKK